MKTKILFKAIICFSLTLFLFSYSYAAENLEKANGWQEEIIAGDIKFNATNETLKVRASAFHEWTGGEWKKDVPNAIGVIATIRVDNLNGNGYKVVELQKEIGTWGNNYLSAEISVAKFEDNEQRCIYYVIREIDEKNNSVRTWLNGNIGNWRDEWDIGDEITVGFARIGDEVWFVADGYKSQSNSEGNCFLKWEPFSTSDSKTMGEIDSPVTINIGMEDPNISWLKDEESFLEATISNVLIF